MIGFFGLARISHAFAVSWLALASVFFYGYWNPAYVGLLLGSIIFNYKMGMWITKADTQDDEVLKKRLLIFAITGNLLLLIYYKYANFFVTNVSSLVGTDWSFTNLILPLGISFFTFTQIAYLVDTYQGKVKEYNFSHYLLFVTYFPHLIAGPVLHHKQMMPQFSATATYHISIENITIGLTFFSIGLAKKVLLADNLAEYATPVFSAAVILIKGMVGMNGISLPISLAFLDQYTSFLHLEIKYIGLFSGLNIPLEITTLIFWLSTSFVIVWGLPNSQQLLEVNRINSISNRGLILVGASFGLLFALSLMSFSRISEFLYFQF